MLAGRCVLRQHLSRCSSRYPPLRVPGRLQFHCFKPGSALLSDFNETPTNTKPSSSPESQGAGDEQLESGSQLQAHLDNVLSDLQRLTDTIGEPTGTVRKASKIAKPEKGAKATLLASQPPGWGGINHDSPLAPDTHVSSQTPIQEDPVEESVPNPTFDSAEAREFESLLKQFTQSASILENKDAAAHEDEPAPEPDIVDTDKGVSNRQQRRDQRKEDGFLRRMRRWTDSFPELCDTVKPEQVLFVTCANKNLNERDFIRTLSRDPEHKPFARVVPLREYETLEKTDKYLVIFHDRASLEAWRAHVSRLSYLSSRYTMRTLAHSEIAPQRDFVVKGEKIDQLVKSYALTPAGSRILTNYDPDTLDQPRNRTAQIGGYGGIVDLNGERRNGVLLRITGAHGLLLSDLLQSIVYDGKVRNMAWTILLSTKSELTSAVPWDAALQARRDKNKAAMLRAYNQKPTGDGLKGSSTLEGPSALHSEQSSEEMHHEAIQASEQAARYHEGERWTIYFYNANDAQRFARTWHRRPLPLPPVDDPKYKFSDDLRTAMRRDEGRGIKVFAEALW